MAPPSAVISTLRHVANTKLTKLAARQVASLERGEQLEQILKAHVTIAEQVRMLAFEASTLEEADFVKIDNIEAFLQLANHDPSVTQDILATWRKELEAKFAWQSKREELTELFGKLVVEWIGDAKADGSADAMDESSPESSSSESSTFEALGREEMYQQRKTWESHAFVAVNVDQNAIRAHLDEIFSNATQSAKGKKSRMDHFRESLKAFHPPAADDKTVQESIRAVLAADLFAGEARRALQDLRSHGDVLKEIANVINDDLKNIDQWDWPNQPMALNVRRMVNGKYRVYIDEEIHTAILLHFIGTHFALALRSAIKHLPLPQHAPRKRMSRTEMHRREFLTNYDGQKPFSVEQGRRDDFEKHYFLTQVPGSFVSAQRNYGDDDLDSDFDVSKPATDKPSPLEIKQKLLHLVSTEMVIQRAIYGEFTALLTDFEWFGPSLPHMTILTVLEYFGLSQKWVEFYRRFISPTVYFADNEDPASARKRQNGVHMSHILSDMAGEAILYCLDYAVSRATDNGYLYRFHDDIWFWGSAEACGKAWTAINKFVKVMGLRLNKEKTGTVTIGGQKSHANGARYNLPTGSVKWGFLKLDANTARWVIDKDDLKKHTAELKHQLAARSGVFSMIQAYNAYVDKFMLNNFGWPTSVLGKAHVDMCVEAIKQVHSDLFGENKDLAAHVRHILLERFGVSDIPDAFFYFNHEHGGLDIANPLIRLTCVRKHVSSDPEGEVDTALYYDTEVYEKAKEAYESGRIPSKRDWEKLGKLPTSFMSMEEYFGFPEETNAALKHLYVEFQNIVEGRLLVTTHDAMDDYCNSGSGARGRFGGSTRGRGRGRGNGRFGASTRGRGNAKETYNSWISELYGHGAIEACGGTQLAIKDLLPLGLLAALKSERVRWQS